MQIQLYEEHVTDLPFDIHKNRNHDPVPLSN